jgi:hypothetical protein
MIGTFDGQDDNERKALTIIGVLAIVLLVLRVLAFAGG